MISSSQERLLTRAFVALLVTGMILVLTGILLVLLEDKPFQRVTGEEFKGMTTKDYYLDSAIYEANLAQFWSVYQKPIWCVATGVGFLCFAGGFIIILSGIVDKFASAAGKCVRALRLDSAQFLILLLVACGFFASMMFHDSEKTFVTFAITMGGIFIGYTIRKFC